jgi:glucan endo-1,6-beta-glucosidase
MISTSSLAAFAALASLASAWLPTEGGRQILDKRGSSLFNNTNLPPHRRGTEDKRWLPASGKIRGVNLGALFVFEPWLAHDYWEDTMHCTGTGYNSEFDCMSLLGAITGDAAFQGHWNTWITEKDFDQMLSYNLNTVRIPIGYWMDESIVYWDSEHFPRGGIDVLKTVCGWASDRGFYIILDMHGAPGAQVLNNSDTGQVTRLLHQALDRC